MAMSFEQACEVQLLRRKLAVLRDSTSDSAERALVIAQMQRLEPVMDEAGAVVMEHTDAEFQAVADQLKEKMKPLNAAIQDLQKISAAIAQAAALINALVAVLGKVGFV
jgi:ABC-type transporter Mla subunit MlaD